MTAPILEIRGLSKSFRSYWTFRPLQAVNDVSLSVYGGESFGFLGHNGAGKTTTIKCILGLIHKTKGDVYLDGQPLCRPSQRATLGYLPEQPYFYDHLTVEETLNYFAALCGMRREESRRRVRETLEMTRLAPRAKDSVRALSKGWQQRLGLAQAILNQPRLLFLDEPFSGLDPLARVDVRELILDLRAAGTTIFMSSHILSDIQEICDRVAIMAQGTLRSTFALAEVPQLFGQSFVASFTGLDETKTEFAQICELADSHRLVETASGSQLELTFSDHDIASNTVALAVSKGALLVEFHRRTMKLEDIFLKITEGAAASAAGDLETRTDRPLEQLHP